jgi:pyruvate ferredoxin oxidoreductase delta subunit
MENKLPKSIRELPFTCLSPAVKGSAGKTGSWRTLRPVFDKEKCTKCLLCWVYCPEATINRDANDCPVIDYDYCKGCGICAHECPTKALTMKREGT